MATYPLARSWLSNREPADLRRAVFPQPGGRDGDHRSLICAGNPDSPQTYPQAESAWTVAFALRLAWAPIFPLSAMISHGIPWASEASGIARGVKRTPNEKQSYRQIHSLAFDTRAGQSKRNATGERIRRASEQHPPRCARSRTSREGTKRRIRCGSP
ncbi:hypothetical protein Rumeso_03166 [Rubellimicrobium mesophilum DSM 19309]|uniref:Uncharacterized protein n=1 Tax=Rubellimicrobium mesophilum DSM 19309 TaxID=442562 RepID=A0A017HLQ1_9RHOB|nr:hypothetical protein Rumeso_03166 [Rubellimicrobium mesophilum DSM 19309]